MERKQLIQIFLKKNQEINLSAIRDEEGVQIKHINDSLELTTFFQFPERSHIVDIGTWSWFPLIPLALTFPQSQFTGIDSIKKKTLAVNSILEEMEIHNAHVIRTRIEEYKEETFDFLTARAVAYSDQLLKRCYHLVRKGGSFIFFKQKSLEEEEILKKSCKKYHLDIVKKHEYHLFDGDIDRIIYLLKKQ